ncbi:hypothetical protein KKC88_03130 [Patescibacteria group bacterium]|nr:hypothetical protein [Patescibacteria group bacterium]MBU1673415.1 hypothetical protein [Patescibacteria group bacterium]MBU1963319.1 hypothetical protein [Patescibacteria group bacterium]
MKKFLVILIPLIFLGAFCTGPDYESIENGQAPTAAGADMAFIRDGQLFAAKSGNAEVIQLTNSEDNKYGPAFFPSRFDVMYLKSDPPYSQFIKYNLKTGEEDFLYATKGEPNYYEFAPSGQFALFKEDGALFLLDIELEEATQVATDTLDAAWSPDSKSFVYTNKKGELFIREFNVKEKINDPEIIYEGDPRAPQYLDPSKLIFEECQENKCTLVEFDLYRREISRDITSFDNDGGKNPVLLVAPDKDYIAYQKMDPQIESTVINIISYPAAEKIDKYEYASHPFWLKVRKGIVFIKEELDENENFKQNMYLTEIGQEPVLFLKNTTTPVTTGAYQTNL